MGFVESVDHFIHTYPVYAIGGALWLLWLLGCVAIAMPNPTPADSKSYTFLYNFLRVVTASAQDSAMVRALRTRVFGAPKE